MTMVEFIRRHWGKLIIAAVGFVPMGFVVITQIVYAVTKHPLMVLMVLSWICCIVTLINIMEGNFRR